VSERAALIFLVSSTVAACGSARVGSSDTGAPTLTLPTHFAEGHSDGGAVVGRATTAAVASGDPAAPHGAQPQATEPNAAAGSPAAAAKRQEVPDPVALSTASQWELTFHYSKGAVQVARARAVQLEQPLTTARRFGRFAVELWIGKELVERVRFDFPLLGGEAPSGPQHPLHEPARFSPGADTTQKVLVPDSERATFAVLVDRATGQSWPLVWPPAVAPVADGGAGPR
jgi:hypothetical protein